jgi:predicted MFS family arabinose efflux permease
MPNPDPSSLRALRNRPEWLLLLMAVAVPFSFDSWQVLLNNFAIERAAFGGAEIGVLQSLREVPGFLAFTFVLIAAVVREQRFAVVALLLLGIGTAITGLAPSVLGLYATTVLMSTGFHYFETAKDSLALQWIAKPDAPRVFGRIIAASAMASLIAYGLVFVTRRVFEFDYAAIYMTTGGATICIAATAGLLFPRFETVVAQRRELILRRRYWLYYLLTFLSGARRQIFTVFAGFMMVERFGYTVENITLLFLVNAVFNIFFATRIGGLIGRFGERRALTFEYLGLVGVFLAYAFVQTHWVAAGLYLIDHAFFAMAIAIKTYFQKIADPADLASTAGVAFTINHIAAIVLPALFGLLWLWWPQAVFLCGAVLAAASLGCARFVPYAPAPGAETILSQARP